MAQSVWFSGARVGAALVVAAGMTSGTKDEAGPVAFTEDHVPPMLEDVQRLENAATGSALATAAFGLSALQPETFNSQIVLDIIEASPLAYGEKDRLSAKLFAATAGRAELPRVLADIRVSLAVE